MPPKEETIIDGVLHWRWKTRNSPNREWIPYTAAELTEKLTQEKLKRIEESTVETKGNNKQPVSATPIKVDANGYFQITGVFQPEIKEGSYNEFE